MSLNREEILQMDEATLFIEVTKFVQEGNDEPQFPYFLDDKLAICYQGKEKLKEMGLEKDYVHYLADIGICGFIIEGTKWAPKIMVHQNDIFKIAHAHPKQRAQAVLLTVEEVK